MSFLYVVIIVAFLDTFIQLPIIAPYAIQLGASDSFAGIIVAIYSFTNMIGNVFGGHWIDRFGRKRLLIVGLTAVGIILLGYPIVQTSAQLFIIRALHGLAGGILIPATFTLIGDHSKKKKDGKAMAFSGATIGLSAIVGPALGGAMAARAQIETVFILVAILFAITALISLFFVSESYQKRDRGQVHLTDISILLKKRPLIQASIAAFGLMVSNGTLSYALPIRLEAMGYSTSITGGLMSLFAIVSLIIFLTPLHNIYNKRKPMHLISVGLLCITVALLFLSQMATIALAIFAMIIYGIGFAFVFPSMNQLVTFISEKKERGKAYGIFYAAFSLGAVAGSSLSGLTANWLTNPFFFSIIALTGCMISLKVIGVSIKRYNYSYQNQ